MEKDYSERLDFQTLIFIAMKNYLDLTTNPGTHDKRDISLVNIWSMAKYFARGKDRESGKPFDFTGEFNDLCKERCNMKKSEDLIRLDAERFGTIIRVLGKNDLLFKGVQEDEMGEFEKGTIEDD
jgi:hypothetical protein